MGGCGLGTRLASPISPIIDRSVSGWAFSFNRLALIATRGQPNAIAALLDFNDYLGTPNIDRDLVHCVTFARIARIAAGRVSLSSLAAIHRSRAVS